MHALADRVHGSWIHAVCIGVFVAGLANGTRATAQCLGDCDTSGDVTIDEIVSGVSIALGEAPLALCPAFSNGRQEVTIAEIIAAVDHALNGCPEPLPTPTATGTPSPATPPVTGTAATATPSATATSEIPGLCPDLYKYVPQGALGTGGATPTPVPLSSCQLDATRDVVVGTAPCGPVVYVDQSFTGTNALGMITIESGATLAVPDQTLVVETTGMVVRGALLVGTALCPVGAGSGDIVNQVTLRFLGNQPTMCGGSSTTAACHQKGILVESGGALEMYGEKGLVNLDAGDPRVSWTYLSVPAGPSQTYGPGQGVGNPVVNGMGRCPNDLPTAAEKMILQLATAVDWQPADWIVVGTTDFVEHGSEFVRIACLMTTTSGTTIWLDPGTPLVNYHFGGPAPDTGTTGSCKPNSETLPDAFCDDYTKNYGVDERAEVGLISRNIKLTATVPTLPMWQASQTYATGDSIQATVGASNNLGGTTYQFTATTGGTSGSMLPAFPGSGTVADGSVTWTNEGATVLHWGGEITVMAGAIAQIQGVEIEKFGKDQLGSYPILFAGTPMLPVPTNPDILPVMLNSVSIHHSYNKGIVLGAPAGMAAGASNLMIVNNVVARALGHLFYLADGTPTGNTFESNLGLGAMSNGFSINPNANSGYTPGTAAALFWSGDYLTNDSSTPHYNGYDGFNVPNTDCNNANAWPSGFYITNPDNTFTNNTIGGCQGEGRGFWYLPFPMLTTQPSGCPTLQPGSSPNYTCVVQQATTSAPYLASQFSDNRAHACYTGLDTASDAGTDGNSLISCPLAPQYNSYDLITKFSGMTASRNRNRGIWVRPGWYHIAEARVATNRDSISLVSSGGTEGSPPGEWGLLTDSILVGISTNNPGRFGPCPYFGQGAFAGGALGCVNEGQSQGNGYPVYTWNLFGFMFYDGPARLQDVKLINFLTDPAPYLMDLDHAALSYYARQTGNALTAGTWSSAVSYAAGALVTYDGKQWEALIANTNVTPGTDAMTWVSFADQGPPFQYEGDAAFGWFQSNVNSYPPTQYSEELIFDNVDLRHEVYTQSVNQSGFVDGDKNTVILDVDGTLTDYQVVGPNCMVGQQCTPIDEKFPLSLNNLPFLGTPNSVDECLSEGVQDSLLEARPTSLISPQDYATLEFSMLTPGAMPTPSTNAACPGNPLLMNCNPVTFSKDQLDYMGQAGPQYDGMRGSAAQPLVECPANHSCMNMVGRNQQGIYEPKVINQLGYTVAAQQGLPAFLDVAYTDATVAGGLSATNPFQIRLGLCYASSNGKPAASLQQATASCSQPPCPPFTVVAGRKSLGQPFGTPPALLATFWNALVCNGLDNQDPSFKTNCPAAPITTLTQVTAIADLTPSTYFYDSTMGMLFFYVQQTEPNGAKPGAVLPNMVTLTNGGGPSPLGSCVEANDASCLEPEETFYSCPEDGCVLYAVTVEDPTYTPGASNCEPYIFPPTYDATTTPPDYTLPWPTGLNQLAYKGGSLDGMPVQTTPVAMNPGIDFNYPHTEDQNAASICSAAVTAPPWIGAGNPAPPLITTYTIGLPANVSASFSPAVTSITTPSGPLFPLADGTYAFTANQPNCATTPCSCTQSITVTGGSWTSSPSSGPGSNCCQLGLQSNPATPGFLGPAAPPYNSPGCSG